MPRTTAKNERIKLTKTPVIFATPMGKRWLVTTERGGRIGIFNDIRTAKDAAIECARKHIRMPSVYKETLAIRLQQAARLEREII
jgi:hypothetical protein